MTDREASTAAARMYWAEADRRLIAHIDAIEGHWPPTVEIARRAEHRIMVNVHGRNDSPAGRIDLWLWDGVPLFECIWWPEPEIAFRFQSPDLEWWFSLTRFGPDELTDEYRDSYSE